MEMKDLNNSQIILLTLLLSFVTSIATGIMTASLLQQSPSAVTIPITRIVKQTVESVVPKGDYAQLTKEQEQLLNDLKAIESLTVSLYKKGQSESEDMLLGTGLFLGENKVVIASLIEPPVEGEVYVVKSILGEKQILDIEPQEDFTVIELEIVAEVGEELQETENQENSSTE